MQLKVASLQVDVIDVSMLSHPSLEGLGDSVLAQALRELLEPGQGEEEVFARFENSMAPPRAE
ncbi:hypothetical protein [Nonomuraea aurantiaca]|jgi:hypothetical protein|uniref:hypothetical protein n=1 Tax=Nonomuraea aurantiaca TaxID=2878562 RepID=UPI001CDA4284|nr:hypothetical protein [Nonomuraea aurantiaca]MCA2221851.1 hypothetical protein [Nonomuraea aurantiaca]